MATTTKTSPVTEEQIDRCSRIFDMETQEPFYMVLSEADNLTEYKVQYHKDPNRPGKGYFTCTCPAGREGFIHCSGPYCKHVRWSIAAAQIHKADEKDQARARMRQEQEYHNLLKRKPYQWTEAEIRRDQRRYTARPFQLMK
ncbi:hypothetical protein KDA_18290 [Dictyobacter alpinus]|uniref:SWIM-type domain-containing protein n=1 Tax=Dictyobacter alpinus TaxID=2014873 RepID=A0A402B4Q6_9CHLR|nr:hypothetical protein [Dictyobacter alpinus]GCE26345.1 hypothetical protein KDA_18290 [Dictyobacter alpinus]